MDSYNTILGRMVDKYCEDTGSLISDESDIMIRMKVLAAEVYKSTVNANWILSQMFPDTASGQYLDMHAAQRGLTRKPAQKATGRVSFRTLLPTSANVTVPQGTIVCTRGPESVRFVTDNDAVIRANDTNATVGVTACVAGKNANVQPNTVNIMVTPPAFIDMVTNSSGFSGGCDEESDDELRKRLLQSYRDISNSTNAAYYKALALSVSGIYSAGVIPRLRGTGTVDVYIAQRGVNATQAQIAAVQALMNSARELNVDVLVRSASAVGVELVLYLGVKPGYDFNETAEQCEQRITDFVEKLGIGENVLLSEIGEIVYHTEGVADYAFDTLYSSDVRPSQSQFAHINRVSILQRS